MSLGIKDVLKFGKHKGTSIDKVLETDPSWLLWYRQTKKEEGKPSFSLEVHGELDKTLMVPALRRSLRGKFQPWNLPASTDMSVFDKIAGARDLDAANVDAAIVQESVREMAYPEAWGSW